MYILKAPVEEHYILYCEGELHGKQIRMAKLVGEAPTPQPADPLLPSPGRGRGRSPSPEGTHSSPSPELGILVPSLGLCSGNLGRAQGLECHKRHSNVPCCAGGPLGVEEHCVHGGRHGREAPLPGSIPGEVAQGGVGDSAPSLPERVS